MRVLISMFGPPGSGKSTFIRENNLDRFRVSSDVIREFLNGVEIDMNGKERIRQGNSKNVWDTMLQSITARMKRGELIVVDHTSMNKEFTSSLRKICRDYRYRFYILDFLNSCKEDREKMLDRFIQRDLNREQRYRVGGEVIEKSIDMLSQIGRNNSFVIPEEIESKIYYRAPNYDKYNEIRIISDIHGFKNLAERFLLGEDKKFKDDTLYIMLGDYLDKGIDDVEVFNWIYEIKDYPNVLLVEGNHDRSIKFEAGVEGIKPTSEYRKVGVDKLSEIENYKEKCEEITQKLLQCLYFEYNGNKFLCSHSGVQYFDERIITYSRDELCFNDYPQNIKAKSFEKSLKEQGIDNVYQIFGHIPLPNEHEYEKSFCIDNTIDTFGKNGEFRVAVINKSTTPVIIEKYTKDDLLKAEPRLKNYNNISELLVGRDEEIVIKKFEDDIISLNFSKGVFRSWKFNDRTIKARGLFYSMKDREVALRSYRKFFNFGELYEYGDFEIEAMSDEERFSEWKNTFADKLKYPVKFYRKENGFLGLVSLYKDKVRYASKSVILEDSAFRDISSANTVEQLFDDDFTNIRKIKDIEMFKDSVGEDKIIDDEWFSSDAIVHSLELKKTLLSRLSEKYSENRINKLEEILKDILKGYNRKTLLFEVCCDRDKHTIKYTNSNEIFLLDIVDNTIEDNLFQPFEKLQVVSDLLNVSLKEEYSREANNFDELVDIVNEIKEMKGIEGYVAVDRNSEMFKIKTDFYVMWRNRKRRLEYINKTGSDFKNDEKFDPDRDYRDFVNRSIEYYGYCPTENLIEDFSRYLEIKNANINDEVETPAEEEISLEW